MIKRLRTRLPFSPARTTAGRVNRRLVPLILVAFAVVGLLGASSLRETARFRLGDSHRFALDSLQFQLNGRIERITLDARSLAELAVTRQYALTASDTAMRNVAGRADVVREFLRLLDRHPESYLAVRYVTPDGVSRIETLNLLEGSVVSDAEAGRSLADDPLLERVLRARPGEVLMGALLRQVDDAGQPLEPPQAVVRFATPVRFFDTAQNVIGAVVVDVRARTILDVVNNARSAGQRVLLLDSPTRIIADSANLAHTYMLKLPPDTDADFSPIPDPASDDVRIERMVGPLMAGVLAQEMGDYIVSARSLTGIAAASAPFRLVILEDADAALGGTYQSSLAVFALSLAAGAGVSLLVAGLVGRALAPYASAGRLARTLATADAPPQAGAVPQLEDADALTGALADVSDRLNRLSTEMERQRRRLAHSMELTARIARETAMLRDLDALVNRVLGLVCDGYGFDHAQVFLLDDAGVNAVLVYSRGAAGADLLSAGLKVPVGAAMPVGRVAASGRTAVLNGLAETSGDGLLPGMRARLVAPLYAGSDVTGVFDVQSAAPEPFGEFEVQTLTLLAGQLTLALDSARLMMQTEQRGREIAALNRQRTREAWDAAETRFGLERVYSYDLRRVEAEAAALPPQALSVPIRVGAEVVGTLDAAPPPGQPFSDDEQAVMRAVADRLALALENARLFQETQLSLRETSMLYELNRRLNEANTLADIIQAVIEAVVPDAAGGHILEFEDEMPDEQPGWLRAIAAWPAADGEGERLMFAQRIHIGDHPLLAALQPDRVLVVNDVAHDTRLDDRLRHMFQLVSAAALVVVPLNVRGLWRGVILLEFPAPRAFTEQEGRIYTALIDQAGVAVDNRLLLHQTEMTLTQIERLYGASRIINTAQSMQDLVRAVVTTSNDLRLDYALSLLEGDLDADGWPTSERLAAFTRQGEVYEHDHAFGLRLPSDSPMRNRAPQELAADDPAWPLVQYLRAEGARYCAAFPLFSANRPVALFYVLAAEAYEMAAEDYEVYLALAGQMSTVLQNRRLLDQTAQALDETRRLYAASRAISEAADSQAVYQAAAAHLSAVAERVSRVLVLLAWPEQTLNAPFLDYAFVWTPGSDADSSAGQRVRAADTPYLRLVGGGRAQRFDNLDRDLADDQRALLSLRAEGAVSMVVAPLRARHKWFGALVCHSDRPHAFDEADTRFVQAVADQVALAVENRQLFEEAQAEARRALALAEAGQLAARIGADFTRSISEVYATVAEAAGYDRWLLTLRPDDDPAVLECVVRYGPAPQGLDVGARLNTRESTHTLARAARERQLIIVNDPAAEAAFAGLGTAPLAEVGKHLSAPVVVGDQMLGALLVGRALHEADLTERDAQLVTTLAAQVAVAVENRRLFRAVEAERQTLRSILDTMPSGVLVLDAATFCPVEFNDQIEALLGRPVDMNRPFNAEDYAIYHTGTNMRYSDRELPIFIAAEIGDVASIDDLVVVHDDGTQIDLLMNAAPIRDSGGEVSAIVAAVEDISGLRGLENALQDNLRETIALFEATRALSEADSIDDVLDTLLAQLVTIEPDDAAIAIYDERVGDAFTVRALATDPSALTPPAAVLDPASAVMIADIAHSHYLDTPDREALARLGMNAIATIPLRVPQRDLPLGWLVLLFASPHEFSPEEDRFLTTLADSGAVALDNRYLFASTQDALREASTLYRASRALADATGPADVLRAVIDHLVTPATSRVLMALLDAPAWDSLDARAEVAASWAADGSEPFVPGAELTPATFAAWRLLVSPKLLTIADSAADPSLSAAERALLAAQGARALIVLPLRAANRPLGAIWLAATEPGEPGERDRRVFQAFMEQASLTLEAARLVEQTENRAHQLATSAQVSQFATSVLDLDVLLPRLVDLMRDAFGYDHVQVFLMDREGQNAVLRASTGAAGRALLGIGHSLPKGSNSVIGQTVATGQPVIALDTGRSDVIHRPNPYLPDTRSELALPLMVQEQVVGALDVQSNRPNAFDQEDVTVLTTLAAQIAVAIDNARLFRQSERRASDMSLLFAVTTAAAAAETLADALDSVAEDLRQSLDALAVGIYLPRTYIDELSGALQTRLEPAAIAGGDTPLAYVATVTAGDPTNAVGVAAASFRSRILNVIEPDSLYTPLVAAAQSAVIVPLASATQLVGLITMESAEPFAYTPETLTLLQTMGGTLSAIIQNAQLLEQLQRTNEQLRELDRVKSEFLANMSHELRTPLNSIIGFSRVILKGIDGPLTEMQEQDLTTIYNSGQHLLGLINDILDQAKIASGKMDLKQAYFDIKPVVEGVRSIGIGLVKDKPINILLDIQSGLPEVYGDEFRTRQVLLNLVSNAAKFTQQGSITLAVYAVTNEANRRFVRVDVVDTGIGIAVKDMPLLFEAFRQVDSSLTRTAGGTGLGLPISKSLVEMQGGEMLVVSQVGQGSTFSITIPTEPVKAGTGEHAEPEIASQPDLIAVNGHDDDTLRLDNGGKTGSRDTATLPSVMVKRQVLLIEDIADRVDQFRRIIQRDGFDVFTASTTLEAEAMASGLRPSVIVMDVNFAGGQGWDILSKLKQREDTGDIPVVVATLSDESERAFAAGAHAFLQHPILPEQLSQVVLEAEQAANVSRILIIDDQPESARLLKELLDENGHYRVFAAPDGAAGVSLVARRRPDLVILDLNMPGKDGFEVLDELRANPETSGIPVLVVTSRALDPGDRERLAHVHVFQKTELSDGSQQQFIRDIETYLARTGG